MGKLTISMAIFNCYVSSPEGTHIISYSCLIGAHRSLTLMKSLYVLWFLEKLTKFPWLNLKCSYFKYHLCEQSLFTKDGTYHEAGGFNSNIYWHYHFEVFVGSSISIPTPMICITSSPGWAGRGQITRGYTTVPTTLQPLRSFFMIVNPVLILHS